MNDHNNGLMLSWNLLSALRLSSEAAFLPFCLLSQRLTSGLLVQLHSQAAVVNLQKLLQSAGLCEKRRTGDRLRVCAWQQCSCGAARSHVYSCLLVM